MHDHTLQSHPDRDADSRGDSALQGRVREVPESIKQLYCEWESFCGCDAWADSPRGQTVNYILSWYEADPGVFR